MERTSTLRIQPGSIVEVLGEDNRLMLVGRVMNYTGDMISIQDSQSRELPPVYYNQDVKLRIKQSGVNAIILGKICGSTKLFWKIDRLQKTAVSEKREFFRQTVRASAKVQCVKRSPQAPKLNRGSDATACTVLDISAGGLMIYATEPFQAGDRLLVSDLVLGKDKFRFYCFVQRVFTDPGRGWRFGCRFDGMEQRDEDRLLRAIFAIQRQEIQKSRG